MSLEEKTLKEEHKLLFHKVIFWRDDLFPRLAEFINQVNLRTTLGKKFVHIAKEPPILTKGHSLDSSVPLDADETCIVLEFMPDNSKQQIPISGGKFGRNAENDIVLTDEDISRKHAEIFFLENKFYLKDLKSLMGTLVNLDEEVKLEKGMRFQIGRTYILSILDLKGPQLRIKLERDNEEDIEEEKDQELDFSKIGINKGVIIGKGSEAHIKLQGNKKEIKDHHCMVYCNDKGDLMIEDQKSDSGTWRFLDNIPLELKAKMLFRLGKRNEFRVLKIILKQKPNHDHLLPDTPTPKEKELEGFIESSDICIICCENPKNAILMPCKHCYLCFRCSQGLRVCPICRKRIEGILEIQE